MLSKAVALLDWTNTGKGYSTTVARRGLKIPTTTPSALVIVIVFDSIIFFKSSDVPGAIFGNWVAIISIHRPHSRWPMLTALRSPGLTRIAVCHGDSGAGLRKS